MNDPVRPFTSHVKMMALTLILPHARRWFYQREVQMLTGIAYTPVRAALLSLSDGFGLAVKRTHGNRQYYMIDKDFFLYDDYKSIVFKTTGLGDHLRWATRARPEELAAAFIYGDFAEGTETTETPVKVCVVGDLPDSRIKAALVPAGKLTLKSFPFVHYTPREFAARANRKDPEVLQLIRGRKIFAVGKEEVLKSLGSREPKT